MLEHFFVQVEKFYIKQLPDFIVLSEVLKVFQIFEFNFLQVLHSENSLSSYYYCNYLKYIALEAG